jgi:hypothetical protein
VTPQSGKRNVWLALATGTFLASYFLAFTWRGLLVYYTGDDMMNLYGYWSQPVSALVKANVFFWTPSYRPFGGVVYRTFFGIFGFNPYPQYVVFFAAMLVNLWLAYLALSRLADSREIGALATLLFAFHGKLEYLYYNGGSLYEPFCFLFYFLALFLYVRVRRQGRYLGLGWLAVFLGCLVCSLNSKEMAVTLPLAVLLYELIFHPPPVGPPRELAKWLSRQGRAVWLGGLFVLAYLPAKLSPSGLAGYEAYVPVYTFSRFLENTETYLGYLLYRGAPLTALGVACFYGILIAVAVWMRSRPMWFGLLFFPIALLPVSFTPVRLGYVLYLPLAGLALYMAVFLVGIMVKLRAAIPRLAAISYRSAAAALFLVTAAVLAVTHHKHWPPAPDARLSPYKLTHDQFTQLYPRLEPGAKLLFVHTPLDDTYDMVFLLRLIYRDDHLFITELNGPVGQRIPIDRLGHYDHIFTYEDNHYVELDNADAIRSVQFHVLKSTAANAAFGEAMTVGRPGANQYFVKDVLVGDPKSDGYWTLDQPELKFLLASPSHHVFTAHFFLPEETMKQTGPLILEFYINGRFLDRARYPHAGELFYQHAVPESWLKTDSLTLVKMRVRNPYVAPFDRVKLGVLLRAAAFNP